MTGVQLQAAAAIVLRAQGVELDTATMPASAGEANWIAELRPTANLQGYEDDDDEAVPF